MTCGEVEYAEDSRMWTIKVVEVVHGAKGKTEIFLRSGNEQLIIDRKVSKQQFHPSQDMTDREAFRTLVGDAQRFYELVQENHPD